MNALPEAPRPDALLTENDRLKGSFTSLLWGAMIAATVVHFAIFVFWPQLRAGALPVAATPVHALDITSATKIPAQPAPIRHPASPVLATTAVPDNLTIGSTSWDSVTVGELPEPPGRSHADVSKRPFMTPYTVAPEILNEGEVVRALQRSYPTLLRDAGIGGTVRVYFYIDENGVVRDRRIAVSSGHPQLDSAALKVAGVYRFSPALNLDRKTAVWVQFPITFKVK